MSVTAPSPTTTSPRGPATTTGSTGDAHASPYRRWRAARSASVITPCRIGRVSDELILRRLADLDDDALAALYAPRAEPWLRVNFVSTVDGAAHGPDGLST